MERGPTNEQLMAEMAWVRRRASALLRDDAAAEDIAQDTWIVAAEQQPELDRPLRPWLARVVGNLVHTRRRSQARRHAREIAVEDARSVLTPRELVERVELQRVVSEEVLALAEPYRSTVLLHFFEGISSADLAQRLGLPAGTVRRRLQVGLDQLREALRRREDPPDRGWRAALAPIAVPAVSHAPVAIGVGVMKKLVAVFVVLMVLIGAGLWWRHRGRENRAAVANVTTPAHAPLARAGEASQLPAWLAQEGAPARVQTAGLGGTETEANGHFRACIAPVDEPGTAAARVRVEADGYGTIEEREIVVGELPHDFVLAPEAVLVGTVTAAGPPVAGARVIAVPVPGAWAGDAAASAAASGADGTFR